MVSHFRSRPCVLQTADTVWSLGVKSYDVSLEKQSADVTTEPSLSYETLLEKLKKTGKTIKSAEKDGETLAV